MAGTLTISTLSDGTNSTSATNPIRGSAKAWVNYNTIAQTIISSFNVSSVTYVSTGTFTVNFTTAFSDANYIPAATSIAYNTGESGFVVTVAGDYSTGPALKTASACRFQTGLSRATSLSSTIGTYIAFFGS
jgi:hypothetical protein